MGKSKAGDWEIRLEIGQTGTEQDARPVELMCLLEKSLRAQAENKGMDSSGEILVDTDV